MESASASRIFAAIDRLKQGDRDGAAAALAAELQFGPQSGERWRSVQRLAAEIGEIDMAIAAARRFSRTPPVRVDRLLTYWGELTAQGRNAEALAEAHALYGQLSQVAPYRHFLGTLAGQAGDFAAAEGHFRAALKLAPDSPQTWFALAMIKQFTPDDPDLVAMEQAFATLRRHEPSIQARFLYGYGKAMHDCGEYERAFRLYQQGANLRLAEEEYDHAAVAALADSLIRDFTRAGMRQLAPCESTGTPPIFVNGLPRSGTTLVEQILTSNSAVADGGEVNLLRAALIPTLDRSMAGAMAYQRRSTARSPWEAIAASYLRMMRMRFPGTTGLLVDKTLVQSHMMGLLLHCLPTARVIWLRRNPEDVALSCFRTYFTSDIPWSWSLERIGQFFRLEDRLHAHWSELFPDRILTVRYEDLASDPQSWIGRIAAHAGLADEPAMYASHRTKRQVRTASVQQVRAPISTARIGLSQAYAEQLEPFRRAYLG